MFILYNPEYGYILRGGGGVRSSDCDLICLLWSWELRTSPLYNSFFVSVSHSLKPNNSYILDTKVRKVVKEVDVCSLCKSIMGDMRKRGI